MAVGAAARKSPKAALNPETPFSGAKKAEEPAKPTTKQPNFFVKDYKPVRLEQLQAEDERKRSGGALKDSKKGKGGRGAVNRSALVHGERAGSPKEMVKKLQ